VLIDFGAVKEIGAQCLESEDIHATVTIAVGSSGYMPNEQLAGRPRFSSDIYAVGMLTLQCLTGIYPRKLPEDPQTSEIIWRDLVPLNPEFADILDVMVRYDYRQRYPSAKEALEALRKITDVAPVQTLLMAPASVDESYLLWLERGDELFQQQRYRDAIVPTIA
jgi:serine/threonine protein kinase